MKDVQRKNYYVVFTDKKTDLVGAKSYVDYETAVNAANRLRKIEGYSGIKITRHYNGHCAY